MIPILYRGSVKDVMGPVKFKGVSGMDPGVLFRFSDAYSVFDWGKMPDPIDEKGSALAILAADFFERVREPKTWKEFSRAGEAYDLRNGVQKIPVSTEGPTTLATAAPVSLSAAFNEIGEKLQSQGLRTHYLGVVSAKAAAAADDRSPLEFTGLEGLKEPTRHLAVRQVAVVPPTVLKVLGRSVRDYAPTRAAKAPRLIPLEVVFRFQCPPGSSLLSRAKTQPEYVEQLAIPRSEERRAPEDRIRPGDKWEFPVLELFTKLEPTDRPVPLSEALAMTGLSGTQMQNLLLMTAWVAGFLRYRCRISGLELADGKVEWGLDADGELMLVDAVGPDELRILRKGTQLSKEFLRKHYRETSWYTRVNEAKRLAAAKGTGDWKKLVTEAPPALSPEAREASAQLYWVLTNALTGKAWFKDAWSLDALAARVKELEGASVPVSKSAADRSVMVVGSGGREHALAWKLAQSPRVRRLILAPGNDGIRARGGAGLEVERWEFDASRGVEEFEVLAQKAREEGVHLAVIGPDNPLADGIVDVFEKHGVAVFGPRAEAARLEASKTFAKDVMKRAGVPTAKHVTVTAVDDARKFLRSAPWPPEGRGWVIKADGLALGKGVRVCPTLDEAISAAEELLPLSGKLVIEECLQGVELSWMAFCDGDRCALLEPARDYKRLEDGDRGPNTGGMGAFSPVPEAMDAELRERVRNQVFLPVLHEMKNLGTPFQGVLYAGLMMDPATREFWVLEFNARFGDPETQVLLPRMDADLYDWCEASAKGDMSKLPDTVPFRGDYAVVVVGAAPGYPETPQKGIPVEGPVAEAGIEDADLPYFTAGVRSQVQNGAGKAVLVTGGGRVFGAVGLGSGLKVAAARAYANLERVGFKGMLFRRDIGKAGD